MPALAQRKWEVWRKKQRLEQSTPVSFDELLGTCLDFAEPVLATNVDQMQWSPSSQTWEKISESAND